MGRWLGTCFLTFLLTLGGMELYLSAAEIELPLRIMDPILGRQLAKNKRLILIQEGFFLGHSNPYGYIGPAYPFAKEPGVFRIVLMGDSYTEGMHLMNAYRYDRLLEKELNRHCNQKVEILNFGVGESNFADMYLYYENYAKKFNPDLVLFVVSPFSFKMTRYSSTPAPQLYLDQAGQLQTSYAFTQSHIYQIYRHGAFLFEHSSLLKMLTRTYKLLRSAEAPQILLGKFYSPPPKQAAVPPQTLPPEMVKAMQNLKTDPVILAYRSPFPPALKHEIEHLGQPSLDLMPAFRALTEAGVDYHYWKASQMDGHWNAQGHQAVARYLARQLRSSSCPPQREHSPEGSNRHGQS